MRQVAWRCAVGAGDLGRAAELATRILASDPAGLNPVVRIIHALVCLSAERYDDALALLDGFEPTDPQQRSMATAVALKVSVWTLDWDREVAAARRPEADPADQAWLGSKLLKEGRTAQARELLTRACPALKGEVAAQCAALLDQVNAD